MTNPSANIYIGHEARTTGSGGVHAHINPATLEKQADIPLAGAKEVDEAVKKAQAAFEGWRTMRPEARRDILMKFADLIEANAQEFAKMAAHDGGTPLAMGASGPILAASWARYYAGWCDKISGELLSTMDTRGEFTYTVPEPIGIVGIIITWNGPLISLGMKVFPALAAGNCVIVKPAEITPFAPELFAKLAIEAGIPDGVLSLFPGSVEAGEAMCKHEKIGLLSFTGGPITARKILHLCAEEIKPTVMELGGKSASILFPDADIQASCERAVIWSIGCLAGQGCALPTRLLVHESIYDDVLVRLQAIIKNFKVGNPFDETVAVGPVINGAAVDRIIGMFERARAENSCKFLMGGKKCDGELANGNFIEPTLIVDADPDAEICQVEIFGPALVVLKFTDEEEAIRIANNSRYGLAAYIQTSDVKRVHRMAERLEAGGVYVNGAFQIYAHTPFGGIGISGFGKEGGRAGLDEYLHYKTVAVA